MGSLHAFPVPAAVAQSRNSWAMHTPRPFTVVWGPATHAVTWVDLGDPEREPRLGKKAELIESSGSLNGWSRPALECGRIEKNSPCMKQFGELSCIVIVLSQLQESSPASVFICLSGPFPTWGFPASKAGNASSLEQRARAILSSQ